MAIQGVISCALLAGCSGEAADPPPPVDGLYRPAAQDQPDATPAGSNLSSPWQASVDESGNDDGAGLALAETESDRQDGPSSSPASPTEPGSAVTPSLQPAPAPPGNTDSEDAPESTSTLTPAPVDSPISDTPPPSTAQGSSQPIIPEVSGECPQWSSGVISFMGLGGIRIEAGSKAAGPTAPMVFYWHGTQSTSDEYDRMASAVKDGVLREDGVIVSFQDTTGGDLLSGTAVFGESDMALVDQLAACAVRDHNIDPNRIFTTGCSAGGLFATALAVLRSNYIAAAAPNSGGLILPSAFQGAFVPALMTMHGEPGRDVVIVDFSDTSRTADDQFKSSGGFVINCDHGGGHCGAGGLAPDVWEFFLAHPYGATPSPWSSSLPSGFNSSCDIY